MKKTLLPLALIGILFELLISSCSQKEKSASEQYFELKSELKMQVMDDLKSNKSLLERYDRDMDKLTESMKSVIGADLLINEQKWKISLETLEDDQPESGFLDGLIYRLDGNVIFITSEEILKKRTGSKISSKQELMNYVSQEDFHVDSFDWDFSIAKNFDIKVLPTDGVEFVSAFAGWRSIESFEFAKPQIIFVSIINGGKIYVFQNRINFNNEISDCEPISHEADIIMSQNIGVYDPKKDETLSNMQKEYLDCYTERSIKSKLYEQYVDVVKNNLKRIKK